MKVLLLEPQLSLRAILRGVLQTFGQMEIFTPSTSYDAIKLLLSHKIDLLICSERSKPIIGADLMSLIRSAKNTATRRTPMMIVTSTNDLEEIRDYLALGADEVLHIPFSYASVHARIHRVWNSRAAFLEFATYVGPDRRRFEFLGIQPDLRDEDYAPEPKIFSEELQLLVRKYLKEKISEKREQMEQGEIPRKEVGTVMTKQKPLYRNDSEEKSNSAGVLRHLSELEAGMMLAENVRSNTGMLILDTKNPLSEASILRLTDMVNVGRVEETFRVSIL